MKVAVIGDHHARQSIYSFGDSLIGINGLPINDIELAKMFRFAYSRFDLIFWSCGHPLMGCRAINMIRELSPMPFEKRILNYEVAKIPRGFYDSLWWKTLNSTELDFLWENYKQMLGFYLSNYASKTVLLPLSAKWFDAKLNLPESTMDTIARATNRFIDLTPLNGLPSEYFQGETQMLTEAGFNAIKSNLEAYIIKSSING